MLRAGFRVDATAQRRRCYSQRSTETVTLEDMEETNRLLQRGRFRAARRELAPLLLQHPSSPRVLATKANFDALTKVATFQESEAVVRALIVENPDSYRLRAVAAYMKALGGAREPAIAELREIVAEYPDEAYFHQCLAGVLHLDEEHWVEAWQEYQLALASGPLTSPCFKTAAFHIARKVDPSHATLALTGSSAMERAGIQTRSRGLRLLFAVFAAFYAAAILLLAGHYHTAGFVFGALAIATTAWDAYVNDFACCKKCRNFWIGLGVFSLASFVVAYRANGISNEFKVGLLVYMAVLVAAIGTKSRRQRARDSSTTSPDAAAPSSNSPEGADRQ